MHYFFDSTWGISLQVFFGVLILADIVKHLNSRSDLDHRAIGDPFKYLFGYGGWKFVFTIVLLLFNAWLMGREHAFVAAAALIIGFALYWMLTWRHYAQLCAYQTPGSAALKKRFN